MIIPLMSRPTHHPPDRLPARPTPPPLPSLPIACLSWPCQAISAARPARVLSLLTHRTVLFLLFAALLSTTAAALSVFNVPPLLHTSSPTLTPAQPHDALRQPPPPESGSVESTVRQNTATNHVLLSHGTANIGLFSSFAQTYLIQEPLPAKIEVVKGNGTVITDFRIDDVATSDMANLTVVVTSAVSFGALPGFATVRVSIQPTEDGPWISFYHDLHVIGVVLYDLDNSNKHRLRSGRNAYPLVLRKSDDYLHCTVKAAVYAGAKGIGPNLAAGDMTISFPGNESILAWSETDCRVATSVESLNSKCQVAFSVDFSQFSLRVEADHFQKNAEAVIQFNWSGLEEYFEFHGAEELLSVTQQSGVDSSRVTDATVKREGSNLGDSAWKIAVIVVTSVLLANALITLVCCFLRGRRAIPATLDDRVVTVKRVDGELVKEREVLEDKSRAKWSMFAMLKRSDKDSACLVEEPSSDEGGQTVLMLEGRHGGHACVGPVDHSVKDNDLTRLVLRGAVERGVDLEPSTMEDCRGKWEAGDVEVGMPSVPWDCCQGEQGVAGGASAPGDEGARKVVQGVGSAINRIQQVDLLHGPHTRGIVGRNGEVIRKEEDEEEDDRALQIPFSASTVS